MVFDNELGRYKKTEIQILVSLISDSRGDEVKLVGRIRVDLNEFMIDNRGETMIKEQELENCSLKKTQVAKITYELSLVQQEKMNISENPNREAIYGEIDRGVFSDALEYNQFGKQVFGKDFSFINLSKLNRSLNESNSNKMNDSISKLSGSKVESQGQMNSKIEKEDKNPSKSILNESLRDSSKEKVKSTQNKTLQSSLKIQQKESSKKQLSLNAESLGLNKHPPLNIAKQPLKNEPKLDRTIEVHEAQIPSSSLQNPMKKLSPIKKSGQSPRHKSKLIQPVSQQITQIEAETQPKLNYLTQSMFDEQELVIQSLQEQLQQANEMIEQYRLEMELMKEENQRLEHQKSVHAGELESSRAKNLSRNQSGNNIGIVLNNQLNAQNESLKSQVLQLSYKVEEYKLIFAQKEEIIEQKDHVINNLSSEIEMAANQMEMRLSQKDFLFQELNQKYMLTREAEIYLKGEAQKLGLLLEAKNSDNLEYQKVIDELKAQVEALNDLVHNSPVAQLSADLEKKNKRILELQNLIDNQKATIADYELRQSDFHSTIDRMHKTLEENKQKQSKVEESAKKNLELKEKAEQELIKYQQKAKIIQKEKYELTQQIASMNLNAKSLDKLVEEKVLSYKKKYDDLTLTYEEAQNKIAQLKFAVQSYQSTFSLEQSKSDAQIKQLNKKLQNFNKKQHLLRQSLDLLENQSTKIRQFVQEKEYQLRECEQLIRTKDEELSQKNDKLNYLERKLRMSDNAVNDLKLQLKMANAMNAQARQDRELQDGQEDFQNRLFILNEANLQLVQKQKVQAGIIDSKQQSIHELKKLAMTIEPLKHEISTVQAQLAHSQQKCLELKEELKHLNRNTFEKLSKAQEQSSQLENAQKQSEKLQEQISLLEDQKNLMESLCQEKDEEMAKLRETIKNITQHNKKSIQKQLQGKENEINGLKKRISESQNMNSELQRRISALETNSFSESHRKQELLIDSRSVTKEDPEPLSAIRSPIKHIYTSPKCARTKEQQQIYRLNEQLEAYKQRQESYMCNVLDLQQQLEQAKKQKLSASLNEQRQSIRKSQTLQPSISYDKKDLKAACDQLEKLIEQRTKSREAENLIQMIVSNSELISGSESRGTQEGTLFARQKNNLQQKSRILSRQVQKIKALIFKKADIPYKNKNQIIQMLKPCENITNELIKIGESFAKDTEDENEQFSEN